MNGVDNYLMGENNYLINNFAKKQNCTLENAFKFF